VGLFHSLGERSLELHVAVCQNEELEGRLKCNLDGRHLFLGHPNNEALGQITARLVWSLQSQLGLVGLGYIHFEVTDFLSGAVFSGVVVVNISLHQTG